MPRDNATGAANATAALPFCSGVAGMRDMMERHTVGSVFGEVLGQVHSIDGSVQRDALVSARRADEPPLRRALSDRAGVFRLDSVPAGMWIVRVELLGYTVQEHHVRVIAEGREVLCAVLQYSG